MKRAAAFAYMGARVRAFPPEVDVFAHAALCHVNLVECANIDADRQVKIRGQRLEVCEVESAIETLVPGIQASVHAFRTSTHSPLQLVAFVILQQDQFDVMDEELEAEGVGTQRAQKLTQAVSQRLQEQLLSAHVPSLIIPLPKLPVTANGKTDVSRLHEIFRDFRRARTNSAVSSCCRSGCIAEIDLSCRERLNVARLV